MAHHAEQLGNIYNSSDCYVKNLDNIERFPSTLHNNKGVIRTTDRLKKENIAVQIGIDTHAELYFLTTEKSLLHPDNSEDKHYYIPPEFEDGNRWRLYAVDFCPHSIATCSQRSYVEDTGDRISYVCASIDSISNDKSRTTHSPKTKDKAGMLYELNDFHVGSITLLELFKGLEIDEEHFYVLMIDIDADEHNVLINYDWTIKPKLLIVEIHISAGTDFETLINHIVNQGYSIDSVLSNQHPYIVDPDNINSFEGHSVNARFRLDN